MMRKNRTAIYHSRKHLLLTFFLIVLPFLFLLAFSSFTKITLGKLLFDVLVSFFRLFLAYIVSAVLAWILAASFYRGKKALVALPIFDVLQSFPTFAALPLATFVWGPSNFTVIFFLIMTIIWPIFFSLISAFKMAKHDWLEAISVMKLGGFNYIKYFLWPISAPALITGSIIGLGEGWEALIATEIIVKVQSGLGSFFQFFSNNPQITAFGILGFLILIFSVNKLIWLPLLEKSHRFIEE